MKKNKKRILAGALAVLIGCSTLLNSGLSAYAAGEQEVLTETPAESPVETSDADEVTEDAVTVETELSEDEQVTAEDITLEQGQEFDVYSDFTGLTISPDKVKVTLKEAVGTQMQDFDCHKADTYTAVYKVEPYSGKPSYEVVRKIIVREKEPETDSQSGQKQKSEESDDEGEGEPQKEEEAALADMTSEQVLEKGEALVNSALASDDLHISFSDEDLELYMMYQSLLSAGAGNGPMYRSARIAESKLVVKHAKNQSGKWDIPVLDYIYSSKTQNQVHNYVKYIDNDEANGWRLAYCLQVSAHFIDSTEYIGKEWKANGMYSEIAYAIENGCKVYGDRCKSAYSTGNWIKDYYVTQSVIYCILSDYGYDGHPLSSLSPVSGYQDVYDCVQAMYKDVKKNGAGEKDGYGDSPSFQIVSPSSTEMKLTADGNYYQTDWYKVKVEGDLSSRSIKLEGAPAGTEIVFNDPSNLKSKFYIRIPAEKAHNSGKDTASFKVKATAKFTRPFIYTYEALIADAQNVTFLEKHKAAAPKDSVANVSLKLEKSKIRLIKKDAVTNSVLEGAVFGIYSDAACTDLITKMPATDKNGASEVEILKTQDTVYLKEITAPAGYQINTEAHNVALKTGKTTSVTVADKEQKGNITVLKNGEVLTGVTGADGNISFVYSNAPYAGAKYNIYAAEDLYSQDKVTKIHKAGDLIESLETGADGSCTSGELYLGKYKVVEQQAPADLVIGKTEEERTKYVTLSYAGQTVELAAGETSYTNERPDISVKVVKRSQNDDVTLEGAIFGLYAKDDIATKDGRVVLKKDSLIETAVSDIDGNAAFHADLPLNFHYTVKEIQAPDKYYMSDASFEFLYDYKDDQTYTYVFEHEFKNEEVRGEVHVNKIDKDSQDFISQGDASLAGAVYGIYAAEDIEHPNKKSGMVHKKGELVQQGVISKEGTVDFTNLYLGNYVVKEIEPGEGYLLDETEYPVSVEYEGQEVKIVHRYATVKETVKKQAFQLIKISEDGEQTETDLIAGAGFKVFLISSLSGVKDGSVKPADGNQFTADDFITYDYSSDETASYYENGEKIIVPEMFTDEKGYLCSPELPYGDYVVFESTTPENLKNVNPFIVRISEDSREPQVWRIFDDRPLQFYFKIVKKDAQTQTPVLNNSASYKIYDLDNKKYVEMIVRYPKKEIVSVFKTNEEGYLLTPEQLKCGNYRIEEISAPVNYVEPGFENTLNLDGEQVPLNQAVAGGEYQEAGRSAITVKVDSNTVHQVEEETGKFYVVIEQSNDEAVGSLTLNKKGEKLTKAVNIEEKAVSKIKNGIASLVNKVSNFFTDEDAMQVSLGYDFTYEEGGMEGAEFAVYAKEVIYTPDGQVDENGNRIIKYEQDMLVGKITTDTTGTATLNNLPIGRYYLVEEKAGQNCVLDPEAKEFEIQYKGQQVAVDYVTMDLKNERQKIIIELLKKDAETKMPIEGVEFGLFADEDIKNALGEVVVAKDSLIELGRTDENGILTFQTDLPHAKYKVIEVEKKPGYLENEETYYFDASYTDQKLEAIHFTSVIENRPTITEFTKTDVTGEQEVEGAKLQILKDGEAVEEWVSEKEPHIVYALEPGDYILHEEQAPTELGYVRSEDAAFVVEETGEVQKVGMKDDHTKVSISKTDITDGKEIQGATLQIIDKDGKIFDEWTTGEEHLVEYIPVGTYTLREKAAIDGYVIADDVEFEVKETGEIQKVEMKDERAMGRLAIKKTDGESKKALSGVEFSLVEKDGGKEVAKLVTDKDGKAESELLPIGTYENGTFKEKTVYVLKETKALDGYEKSEEEWEIVFEYKDGKTPVIEVLKEIQNKKVPEEPETPASSATQKGDGPKTGDDTNWILPFIGIILGGCGVGFALYKKRKQRRGTNKAD